jgi:hypothetical protein
MNAYRVQLETGIRTLNEVRRLEDLSDVKGGDEHWKPLNIGVVGEEPK